MSTVGKTVSALFALTLAGLVYAQGFNPGNAVRINGVEISNQRLDAYYMSAGATRV